jgi:hypothetical protein
MEGQNPEGELYFVFKDSLWLVSTCVVYTVGLKRRQSVGLERKQLSLACGSSELQARHCTVIRHVFPCGVFR